MTRVIVDRAVYLHGVREPCGDLSDELDRLRGTPDGFLWIGLKDPSDEEFEQVQHELALHPLAVEDAVKGNQRSKLEVYDDSVFVVLRPLQYTDATSQVETGELMIFLGDHFVVTVRRGDPGPLGEVRHRLDTDGPRLAHGPASVLHAVMDAVVDGYLDVDQEIGHDLEEMEESVFASEVDVETRATGQASPVSGGPSTDASDARRIYLLKREVLEIRRAVHPLTDVAVRLSQQQVPFVPGEVRPFFRDVADHLLRITDHVESYDRLLTDILSAHLTRISVQQNDDMRRISAWVAMAAVPTMIAGIYGMNFDHMPELHWQLGYPLAVAVMAAICLALYRAFKRSGWL
ncbi:MAG TPA: magnesium and cobalt transport protein CorA [Actinomycetales bacterium]|nr:magnesium and cobalt transport protein CorA [Actinomycetales bacterium]